MRLTWVGFPVLIRLMPETDPIETLHISQPIGIRSLLLSLRASGHPTVASILWTGIVIRKMAEGASAASEKGKFSDNTRKGADLLKIGYIRVSTLEQNTIRQEVLMRELGVDELYIDKASGKSSDRPELQKMMGYVRKGDTVIVEAISRFARNTKDLLELVERLTAKGVEFVSKKEAIDTTTPTGKFMLTVFGAVAELEREYILQRQREGIDIAKAQGKYTGRKAIVHPDFEKVVAQWKEGRITAVQAMNRLGMSKPTFYRKVRQQEEVRA